MATRDHFRVFDTITTDTLRGGACCRARDIRETCYAAVPSHACRYTQESNVLVALRDALPPKLISGELRVSGAGQHIERVA